MYGTMTVIYLSLQDLILRQFTHRDIQRAERAIILGQSACYSQVIHFSVSQLEEQISQAGSMSDIVRSIKDKLMVLPDDTKVYTGHGEGTSIGYERVHNPFIGA